MKILERFPWLRPLCKTAICVVFWYPFALIELLLCYTLYVGGWILATHDGAWWTILGILLLATPLPHLIEHPRMRWVGVLLYLIPATIVVPKMLEVSASTVRNLEDLMTIIVFLGIPLNRVVHFWLEYFGRGPYRDQIQETPTFDNFWNL